MSVSARVLLIFRSIHDVLAAERALGEAGVPGELVPVPKEISPNCGMAVIVAPGDRVRALEAVGERRPIEIIDGWRA